ncbi:MAG: RluA family pseudouridine synthase [Treponema sp.]|nr:RluA family pseudouridine synthase [Treponema sp.]
MVCIMDFDSFSLGQDDIDRRLDKIIRRFLPDRSLSEVYGLIRKGLIKINGKKTKENYHIQNGDTLGVASFLILKTDSNKIKRSPENDNQHEKKIIENIEKNIVFRNEHLLIINKPYDIKVHGDNESLESQVKIWYQNKMQNDSLSFRPGPLHRLDKKTTGLLVFSLSSFGARWFTENIENHVISKNYLGLSEGKISELGQKQRWEDKLSKNEGQNNFRTVKKDDLNGKTAITNAIPLKYGKYKNKDITLTRFEIETGRTHQIRCQSFLHGFPLLGDTAYKGSPLSGESRDFYLHAWKLIFPKNNPLNIPEEITCFPDDFLFI